MLTQNLPNTMGNVYKTARAEGKKSLRWFVALSTLPLLGVVTAFGLVPQSDFNLADAQITFNDISLPKITSPAVTGITYWRDERMQRGDTVATFLNRLNVDDGAATEYLSKAPETASFRKLRPGSEAQAEITANGNLVELRYLGDNSTQFMVEKQDGNFRTTAFPAQLETRLFVRSGEIRSNLYDAIDAAGLPDSTGHQLNDIFSGDIDFHHDLRKGDHFTVVYEMIYSNGEFLRAGRIQAAEFVNQGHTYRAIYFQKDDQNGDYYTPDGKSVHKAFLRSPIEYSRISSRFTTARFHPILNKWRSHKGVDFAAPMGTPVKVTSDGIVSVVGKQGGYGNVIMVRHQAPYSTVYGHLSRFAKGLHTGQRVKQGEIIGYVGMTGLATGPHLHYEFRVNGQQHDPLRIALPDARPLDSSNLTFFKPMAEEFVSRLNLLRNTNLAQLD